MNDLKAIGKICKGVWLPKEDNHFPRMLEQSPEVDGKGTYQYAKLKACLKATKGRKLAVDVGAHVGLWSMQLAKHFDQVLAFEPFGIFAQLFKANLANCTNVALHQVAIGAGSGTVDMVHVADNSGNTHVKKGGGGQVPMTTLESYTSGLPQVDLIKIDVEGFERNVVEGATPTILRCKPIVICENKGNDARNYPGEWENAVEYLESLGMVLLIDLGGDFLMGWPNDEDNSC